MIEIIIPINNYLYCKGMVRKLDPGKQAAHSECVPVIYPDTFSLSDKRCEEEGQKKEEGNQECQQWDINSVCGPGGHCVCRQDMQWNRE